jgi:hypothetical protein
VGSACGEHAEVGAGISQEAQLTGLLCDEEAAGDSSADVRHRRRLQRQFPLLSSVAARLGTILRPISEASMVPAVRYHGADGCSELAGSVTLASPLILFH